jgi:mannosylglucosylglycerate synthase
MSKIGFISFRLGGTDGVSIVASHWIRACSELGHEVRTIAGEEPADIVLPGLAIDAETPPGLAEVQSALRGLDLFIVENLLTIPLNLRASLVVAEALRGWPAILHHHDPPWQRDRFATVTELPVDDPAWRHITVNKATAREFGERGIAATAIWNCFDSPTQVGDRQRLRAELNVADTELLALHPVRAIERKNIPAALRFCEELGATYWLLGDAEEGYDDTLAGLLKTTSARVIRGAAMNDLADAYAACDFVLFPSLYEGFGNPPFEAALHHRPTVVADYPVLRELADIGLQFFDVEKPAQLRSFLNDPDADLIQRNEQLVRAKLNCAATRAQIEQILRHFGLSPE